MRTRQSSITATLAILFTATIWTVDRLTAPDDFRFSFVYMFPLTRTVTLFAMALLITSSRGSSERLRSHSEHAFLLATTDSLTGLYNRRYLDEQLVRIHATAARTHRPYTLLAVDLDGIKWINDSYGHAAGDDAIRSFADDLRASIRAGDLAVRTGGDEFLVVLPEAETPDALALAQRLRQRLRDNTDVRHAPGVSAGVVTWAAIREGRGAPRRSRPSRVREQARRR